MTKDIEVEGAASRSVPYYPTAAAVIDPAAPVTIAVRAAPPLAAVYIDPVVSFILSKQIKQPLNQLITQSVQWILFLQ